MRQTVTVTFAILMLLSISTQAQIQPTDLPPYIYYYSHMMGGLIVERADGSDSRHFATEALPPDLNRNGLEGPGWSPSGRYFGALGVTHTGLPSPPSSYPPAVFDLQGFPMFEWLFYVSNPISMYWSPGDEDLLIVFGGYHPRDGVGSFIWLLDVANENMLAEAGITVDSESPRLEHIDWEVANDHAVIYVGPDMHSGRQDGRRYYRVMMQLDGTVIKEPITQEEMVHEALAPSSLDQITEGDRLCFGINTSPSGLFETYGNEMTNTETGEIITLPIHSQSTICRRYIWSPNEKYILVLSGTLRAGGGCGRALIGITDNRGELWRELGSCYWDEPACVGWLPAEVDVVSLPPGESESVLIEPIRFESEQYIEGMVHDTAFLGNCQEDSVVVVDRTRNEVNYTLLNMPCPFDDARPLEWRSIQVAHLASYDLLATFVYSNNALFDHYVHIWQRTQAGYVDVLRLDTEGYELAFTEDGQYLRARNVNAWKVYSVKEILEAIRAEKVSEDLLP